MVRCSCWPRRLCWREQRLLRLRPAQRSIAGLRCQWPQRTATSNGDCWPSDHTACFLLPASCFLLHASCFGSARGLQLYPRNLSIRRLETNSNHGVAASAAADDTRSRHHGLLTGQRCFWCRPRSPCFTLRLAVRLLPARPCVVLVIVLLARCGCRRRRLLVGNASLAFQALAALALDRAGAGGVLGQFGDQGFRHAGILRRLTLDRQVTAERALGRRVERAIDLARHASEPDQLGLGGADQPRRIGKARRALRSLGVEFVEGCNKQRSKPVAGDGSGKSLQVVAAGAFTALGGQLFEFALFVLAGGLMRRSQISFFPRGFGFSCLLFARGT